MGRWWTGFLLLGAAALADAQEGDVTSATDHNYDALLQQMETGAGAGQNQIAYAKIDDMFERMIRQMAQEQRDEDHLADQNTCFCDGAIEKTNNDIDNLKDSIEANDAKGNAAAGAQGQARGEHTAATKDEADAKKTLTDLESKNAARHQAVMVKTQDELNAIKTTKEAMEKLRRFQSQEHNPAFLQTLPKEIQEMIQAAPIAAHDSQTTAVFGMLKGLAEQNQVNVDDRMAEERSALGGFNKQKQGLETRIAAAQKRQAVLDGVIADQGDIASNMKTSVDEDTEALAAARNYLRQVSANCNEFNRDHNSRATTRADERSSVIAAQGILNQVGRGAESFLETGLASKAQVAIRKLSRRYAVFQQMSTRGWKSIDKVIDEIGNLMKDLKTERRNEADTYKNCQEDHADITFELNDSSRATEQATDARDARTENKEMQETSFAKSKKTLTDLFEEFKQASEERADENIVYQDNMRDAYSMINVLTKVTHRLAQFKGHQGAMDLVQTSEGEGQQPAKFRGNYKKADNTVAKMMEALIKKSKRNIDEMIGAEKSSANRYVKEGDEMTKLIQKTEATLATLTNQIGGSVKAINEFQDRRDDQSARNDDAQRRNKSHKEACTLMEKIDDPKNPGNEIVRFHHLQRERDGELNGLSQAHGTFVSLREQLKAAEQARIEEAARKRKAMEALQKRKQTDDRIVAAKHLLDQSKSKIMRAFNVHNQGVDEKIGSVSVNGFMAPGDSTKRDITVKCSGAGSADACESMSKDGLAVDGFTFVSPGDQPELPSGGDAAALAAYDKACQKFAAKMEKKANQYKTIATDIKPALLKDLAVKKGN